MTWPRLLATDVLEHRLRAKAAGLLGDGAEPLWQAVARLDDLSASGLGALLMAGGRHDGQT